MAHDCHANLGLTDADLNIAAKVLKYHSICQNRPLYDQIRDGIRVFRFPLLTASL